MEKAFHMKFNDIKSDTKISELDEFITNFRQNNDIEL